MKENKVQQISHKLINILSETIINPSSRRLWERQPMAVNNARLPR